MVVILCVSYVTEAAFNDHASAAVVSVVPRAAGVDAVPDTPSVVVVETERSLAAVGEVLEDVSEAAIEPDVPAVPVESDVPDAVPVPVASVPVRALVANDGTAPVVPAPASSDGSVVPFTRAVATAVHEATNEFRQDIGLLPFRYDIALARNAAGYSNVLLENNVLSHTDPWGCSMTCRFRASGYVANAWGENLAVWESSYEPTVEEVVAYVMNAWEKSDGHRDNLLSSTFTHEGVGVARSGNTIYVTVHFAKP
jgi:uncharacterized protein YkwD